MAPPNVNAWRPRVRQTISADQVCVRAEVCAYGPSHNPAVPLENVRAGGPQLSAS